MATKPLNDQLHDERRRVDFDSYDITIQQLTTMVAQRQIDVAPVYQRRFRWDDARQSQLIESLMLGIPVPSLFMATNSDSTWEVVDGVQRLNTLVRFCGDDEARKILRLPDTLQICGLEKLSSLNSCGFTDLPTPVRLQFMLRPVKVTTLSDKSDLKVRFDLFERLNTGGVRLTDQEIRGCIYRGPFNDFLERLALNDDFRVVVRLKKPQEADGTPEEYVLRFFAFLYGYRDFQRSVIGFLNEFMEKASRSFDYEKGERIFNRTFVELARIFPDGLKRRSGFTPVNLFEAVAVGAALTIQKRNKLRISGASQWVQSPDLKQFITGGTNNPGMVEGRIEFAARKFGWS